MSPNSNIGLNEIVSWKGQTFNQISSSIRKNGEVNPNLTIGNNIFAKRGGLPLKLYRREINVPAEQSCNQRTSTRLSLINAPGGTITNSAIKDDVGGLVNTVHFNLTENSSERPGSKCDSECSKIGNTQSNALRRLRSGGMIKKQFDLSNDKQTYYTNTQQYIHSRNRSFNQNQYYYIRSGNSDATPGDSLSANNIYSTNTLTDCKKFYNSEISTFKYKWVNEPTIVENVNTTLPAIVEVTVPVGYYDVSDLNNLLHNTMIENLHYYRRLDNQSKIFLLNFTYNGTTNKIDLTASPISTTIVTSNVYGKALELGELGVLETDKWSTPTTATVPQIQVLDNHFKNIIGFSANPDENTFYPSASATSIDVITSSTVTPLIQPRYNRVYYKPNNPKFAQQGAVSSGSRIARKKYDTITNSASSYTTAYGLHVANALAYGVPANGYTIKDKLGYPNPNTPVVTSTGEMRLCR